MATVISRKGTVGWDTQPRTFTAESKWHGTSKSPVEQFYTNHNVLIVF